MRIIVSGHRDEKLTTYDPMWIHNELELCLREVHVQHGVSIAYSGMASGVDLMFCKSCKFLNIPFIACIPFDGQELKMTNEAATTRKKLLSDAVDIKSVRNSWMVEHCDFALVVWDGNKGGTHNVLQQLVEKKVPFFWINPVGRRVWRCI